MDRVFTNNSNWQVRVRARVRVSAKVILAVPFWVSVKVRRFLAVD